MSNELSYTIETCNIVNDMVEYHTQSQAAEERLAGSYTAKRDKAICQARATVHREMVEFWSRVELIPITEPHNKTVSCTPRDYGAAKEILRKLINQIEKDLTP